jgi:uncharacterized protein (DUF1501 family)
MAFADPLLGTAANNRVFVLFNFSGGISYNLLPIYHGKYRDRNPTISYGPENSLAMNSTQGFHPALTALKSVYDDGQLAALNLIGCGPRQSRSHDEATVQWHTQQSSAMGSAQGWGAKLTSQLQSAFGGVSMAGSNSLVKGGTNPPRVLASLSSLGEKEIFYSQNDAKQLQLVRTNLVAQSTAATNVSQEYVTESILKLQSNVELLKQYATMQLPVTFPNTGLGRKFADAARLIAAGPALNVKFIYLDQGGYDTHAGERTRLTQNLQEFNAAISAFVGCMRTMGRWNDVVLANMSEFTRTMENSSQGTDHGMAGPQMILGGLVKGGQKTPVPTEAEVGNSEFIRSSHGTFAQVFGEIVGEFLELDAGKIFDGDIAASPYFDII